MCESGGDRGPGPRTGCRFPWKSVPGLTLVRPVPELCSDSALSPLGSQLLTLPALGPAVSCMRREPGTMPRSGCITTCPQRGWAARASSSH